MGPLGTLFSAIDTTKRKLGDLFSSPVQSAQQMVGYANDRARGLNELTSGAAQEMKQGLLSGGSTYGPQSQQLTQTLADAYNPMGMTSIGPRSAALETARKNAVKMLGLPENNTAMDRAKALGFDMDTTYIHSTNEPNITSISENGNFPGLFSTPNYSSGYGKIDMPLHIKGQVASSGDLNGYSSNQARKALGGRLNRKKVQMAIDENLPENVIDPGDIADEFKSMQSLRMRLAKQMGRPAVSMNDEFGDTVALLPGSAVRSRFAAFDPARVNENDLLGRADPRLLGLIGIGAAGGVGAYNYLKDKK